MRLIDADVLLELLGKAENLYLERGEWEHYGFLASIMGQIEKQPTITRFSKTKKAAPAMNDKEIIKALECCCVAEQQICRESKCPLFGNGNCFTELAINVLDLINRQKAEIERLEKDRDEYPFKCKVGNNSEIHSKSIQDYDRVIKDIGNEAIKEFVERLKEEAHDIVLYGEIVTVSKIDRIAQEMVGADDV